MTYSVRFRVSWGTIPDEERQEIGRTVQQIAEAVSTVPASSPFWSSTKDSLLQIDVKGWRVVYRVDPGRGEILVVELERIRA